MHTSCWGFRIPAPKKALESFNGSLPAKKFRNLALERDGDEIIQVLLDENQLSVEELSQDLLLFLFVL